MKSWITKYPEEIYASHYDEQNYWTGMYKTKPDGLFDPCEYTRSDLIPKWHKCSENYHQVEKKC